MTLYMVADNTYGPYSGWKVMDGTDADFSHVTQTGFFYTVKGSEQETVLFCGDRWSDFAGNNWLEITIPDIQVTNGKCEVGFSTDAKAGAWVKVDDFSLIGKSEPEPEPEPLHGRLIRELNILDKAHRSGWTIEENLQTGDAVFSDRTVSLTQVPAHLQGAEWIRTACDSKKFTGDQASFTVAEDATVLLGVDSRLAAAPPAWLSGWTKTSDALTDDGNPVVTYELYRKDVKTRETVTIGMNGNSSTVNFLAAVKPYEAPTEPITESTTEPITEETSESSAEAQSVRGDVDTDGQCSVLDAIMLQKWLLCIGSLTDPSSADLNGDGSVDIFDLALLKRELLC